MSPVFIKGKGRKVELNWKPSRGRGALFCWPLAPGVRCTLGFNHQPGGGGEGAGGKEVKLMKELKTQNGAI